MHLQESVEQRRYELPLDGQPDKGNLNGRLRRHEPGIKRFLSKKA
jgi:hypothetical protein